MKYLLALAVLLASMIAACTLKAPLGDPSKSVVDHRLDGVWIVEKGASSYGACLVAPLDERTYIVTFAGYTNDKGKIQDDTATGVCRAWLTDIAGERFMTVQPVAHLVPNSGVEKSYFCARLKFELGGGLKVQALNEKFKDLKSIGDAAALERMVSANVNEVDLYHDPQSYRRCRRDNAFEKELEQRLLAGWN